MPPSLAVEVPEMVLLAVSVFVFRSLERIHQHVCTLRCVVEAVPQPFVECHRSLATYGQKTSLYDERTWFIALCVSSALVVVALLYYGRLLAARSRRALIREERQRIALELHDAFAHGVTGAILHIEHALATADSRRAAEHLHIGKRLLRTALAESERVLFNLRSPDLESTDLATAFETMMTGMTRNLLVRGSVEIEGLPRRIRDRGVENHVLRIGQEAITNALRHSGAARIRLHLRFERKKIVLTVRDDGRGSGPVSLETLPTTSAGFRGMHARAERIRAKLTSRVVPSGGFEIVLEVDG